MATIFCLNQPFLQAVIHVSWTSVAAKVYPSCIFCIYKSFTNSSFYIIFFKSYLQGDYWYEFNTRWREWLSFHKLCLFYAMDISCFISWVYNWNFQVFNVVCTGHRYHKVWQIAAGTLKQNGHPEQWDYICNLFAYFSL